MKALLDAERLQHLGAETIALQTQQKIGGRPRYNAAGENNAAAPL